MSDLQVRGPLWGTTGAPAPLTAGLSGAQRVQDGHSRYSDSATRGLMYTGGNAAAQAVSVALTTTYTGLILWNPIGSGVNLVPVSVAWALSVAPAAIASIGLIGGYSSTGIVTSGGALVPIATRLDAGAGRGKVNGTATLVGTPTWIDQLMGGFTAAALPSSPLVCCELAGKFVIPPGGYIAVGALTAVTGLGAFVWEELPVLA